MQIGHVTPWKLIWLKPTNPFDVQVAFDQSIDEINYGNGGEEMAKDVHIGDNVAIRCQTSTNEDYQILLCDKGLHMIQEGFTDSWGQEWFLGDQVI